MEEGLLSFKDLILWVYGTKETADFKDATCRYKDREIREHQMQLDLDFSMLSPAGKLRFAQSDSHFLICKMGTIPMSGLYVTMIMSAKKRPLNELLILSFPPFWSKVICVNDLHRQYLL